MTKRTGLLYDLNCMLGAYEDAKTPRAMNAYIELAMKRLQIEKRQIKELTKEKPK